MKRPFMYLLIFGVLFASSNAFAHDAKSHKGKPAVGIVEQVEANGFELRTEKGLVHVGYGKDILFEKGQASATKDEVKEGTHASVFGTKLETGEIVAREVILDSLDPPHAQH